MSNQYNDEYSTCAYTHAWLRIMSEELDPSKVTEILNVEPTKYHRKGDFRSEKLQKPYTTSGWFISTKGILESLDARRHIDYILNKVQGKENEIALFKEKGYLVDLCVRWDSNNGHGGPTLSPSQLVGLGELGIEMWFDIYFAGDDFA